MALKFGSTEIPEIKGNIIVGSTIVEKVNVVSGGVTTTVWDASATPYEVDLLSCTWERGTTNGYSQPHGYNTSSIPLYVTAKKVNESMVEFGQTHIETILETKGCNKVKISYKALHYSGSTSVGHIQLFDSNGNEIDSAKNLYSTSQTDVVLDCSGYDSVKFRLSAFDGTAYFTAYMYLYAIEFYLE